MFKRRLVYLFLVFILLAPAFLTPATVAYAQDWDDVSADIDGDGLPNSVEQQGWYNASGGPYVTDYLDADSDDDGLSDGKEKLYGTNPLDDYSPGVYVEYQPHFQTREYYAWRRFGEHYVALPNAPNDAVIIRRGTTFSVGGPSDADLVIEKSLTSLTAPTVERDPCSGHWNVYFPSWGTVGMYTLRMVDGGWDETLNLYVIFDLPTSMSDDFLSAYVYTESLDNRNSQGVPRSDISMVYAEGNDDSTPPPREYTQSDYAWIPEYEWVNHGYGWTFDNQQYERWLFETHIMPYINGYTTTWNAANALGDHVDKVTCLDWPRVLSNSWQVLNPLNYPPYNAMNQCSNVGALLTAFNRSAGIPARPVFTDWKHGTFDHATEVWTKSTTGSLKWYVMRGALNEHNLCATDPTVSKGYTALRDPYRFYTGQGVYALGESWPWNQVDRFYTSMDNFRQNSWDNTVIVKKDWWETRFKAYWGTSSEPTVIGTPPGDWPDDLPPAPAIDFVGTPLVGVRPLAVAFDGTYSGDVNTRAWDFGDGGTSTLADPSHTYQNAGHYTVKLTVQGAGGTTVEEKSNYIHVYTPVNAAFTASPTTGYASLTVNFTDQSTGDVASWDWDFGDGSSHSTVQSPSHNYTTAGDYTVVLTVQGQGGDSDTETKTAYIHVYEPLQAAFTADPMSGPAPLTVTFTDQSTGNISSWGWDFDDGSQSNVQNPVHTFATAGDYIVGMTVVGAYGGGDTHSETISVSESGGSESPSGATGDVAGDVGNDVGGSSANGLLTQAGVEITDSDSFKYFVYLPAVFNSTTPTDEVDSEPVAQFGPVLADYGLDLDDDGRYDQLMVEVEVDVTRAGNYWIRGSLAGAFAQSVGNGYLEAGQQVIGLYFDGIQIYMNKTDGPYLLEGLWITDVEDPSLADLTDSALAYAEPAYETAPYQFSDFGVAGATLSNKYTYGTVDTDGDGYMDALSVETDLDVARAGTYTVMAVLHDGQGDMLAETTWSGLTDTAGAHIQLQFNGLRDTDGPYTLYIHARNADGQVTDGAKEPYVIDALPEFNARSIRLGVETTPALPSGEIRPTFVITDDGYTDTGVDTDGDGKFDQLVITVDVEVEPGEGGQAYRIEGWLLDKYDELIVWAISAPEVLTEGMHSLSLAFDGRIINEHGVDGPYRLIALKALPGETYDVLNEVDVAYTTSTYDDDAFEAVSSRPGTTLFADRMEPDVMLVAVETFEAGVGGSWTTFSSTDGGQIQVTDDYGAAAGAHALLMDNVTEEVFTLNEAIWTVDLSGVAAVTLAFWHAEWGDEQHIFSGDFSGHFNADGIAISADGTNWHPIFDPPNQEYGVWQQYTIDLAVEAAEAGITLGPGFKIKFQQYDNYPWAPVSSNSDGRGWDEIVLTKYPPREQFETGALGADWATSSTGEGRIQVTGAYGTAGGAYALLMDDTTSNLTYSLNEAVWTVDLSDMPGAVLTFWHADFGDEQHIFSGDFSGSYNADGIAISADGNNWHPIFNAPNQTDDVWEEYAINLAVEAAEAGMVLGPEFKIKFQQYDNYPLTNQDGRGWDEITISSNQWIDESPWTLQSNRWHSYSRAWAAEALGQSGSLAAVAQDMTQYVNPTLVFKTCYNMQSPNNVGRIEVSSDGVGWSEVVTYTDATPHWSTMQVDLDALGEIPEAQFRFKVDASDTVAEAIWAIDDVWVTGWPAVTSASFDYADKPVMRGEVITFVASYASVDTTVPVTYTWNFDDGSIVVTSDPTTTHQFADPVQHTVWLTVENPYDNAVSSLPVEVRQAVTETDFTFGYVDLAHDWDVSFSSTYLPTTASIPVTYTWNFGDGAAPVITTSATLTHAFPLMSADSYTVVLTTTNGYADAVMASHIVTVPLDEDGDGIPNSIEAGDDPFNPVDTDTDGTPDYLDEDSDDDGVPDAVEAGDTPQNPIDTDEDTIPDYRDEDDDGDGVDTVDEDVNGNGDPTDDDTDGDTTPNYLDEDDDGDGINTLDEDADGDGDPTNDDADLDGIPNYLDEDSDGDGIPDSEEGLGDPDGDGIPNYLDDDSDGDGKLDIDEGTGDIDEDGIPNWLDDDENYPPVAVDDEVTTVEDVPIAVDVTANDDDLDQDTLSVHAIGTPAHGTVIYAGPMMTYTPAVDFSGTDIFTYTVTDGMFTSSARITVSVVSVDDVPVAIADAYSVEEGGTLEVETPGVLDNDMDGDGDTLQAILVTGVAHGDLVLETNGSFVYTHDGSEIFIDSFTYQAYDGALYSDGVTVTLQITPVNDAPVLAIIDDQSVDEGTLLSFTATATDVDTPANILTFSLGAGAPTGASITSGGAFTWTPSEEQGPGVYPITVQVTDGALSGSATFTVTVVNVAPVLAAITDRTVDEETLLSFTATATDVGIPANTLTFSLGAGAPEGAGITSDGDFTWTPAEAQGPNAYPIIVGVSDGVSTTTTSFTVTVKEVNVAPVLAAIGNKAAVVGMPLSFTTRATDADIPANTLTFSLDAGAPTGASITSGGQFSWTPAEVGLHTVTVRVRDNGAPVLEDAETFQISVTAEAVNLPPDLDAPASQTVDEETLLSLTVVATDPNAGDILTFTLAADAPEGANITSDGAFTWTPTEAQGPDVYPITVQVTDGALSGRATFTVTVNEVNAAPVLRVIGDKAAVIGLPLNFTATATDADIPANALTFSLDAGAPAGASITADGVFNWTPTVTGTYAVTIRVSDDGAPVLEDAETFQISVTAEAVNFPPALDVPVSQTVDEETLLSFTVVATDPNVEDILTFTLAADAPEGASITSGGDFTWTPTEAQGPDLYPITVQVTDGALSDSATFTVTVNEVNAAPVLGVIGNQNMELDDTLTFTATATDVDIPKNVLTFSLAAGAPSGATITSAGLFSWTPTALGVYSATVQVSDGIASASKTFNITVLEFLPGDYDYTIYLPLATRNNK